MDNIILMPVPLESLLNSFRQIIREEIKAEQNAELQDKLLTTAEVCKMFNKSAVTINNWINKGLLIKHTQGGRNYFKYSEIMANLHTLKKYTGV